ncbi:MAG: trypsin-like peptidase domain-containing protein, partial [Chloroflexota bacterium]
MERVRTRAFRHRSLRLLSVICALATLVFSMASPALADSSSTVSLPDFPVPNGHFYSQASGKGVDFGYTITDGGGASFNSEFLRLGGVDRLGYPSSGRFALGGYLTQATQKALLQWRPETRHVDFVNVFDIFSQRGLDPTLARTRLIPPTPDNHADRQLTWPGVVARHLAILDQNPAIKARYFSNPTPIDSFGLPQASQDYGAVVVVRCERAAFQYWRINTSFARAGDVTQVNAGDLAKDFGLVPTGAVSPDPASGQVIAPLGDEFRGDASTDTIAARAASRARPSLVRIDVILPDGTGIASGIVIDQNGDIMTNAHVVADAMLVRVTFVNGNTSSAQILGVNSADDLAVIQVPTSTVGAGVAPA